MKVAQALQFYGELDSYERRECAWLLEHILKINHLSLKYKDEQVLSPEQQQQFLMGIERLKQGEPLAYVIGEQAFWTLTLKVTPATLIPRPDTEVLVEQALALIDPEQNLHILDLGTGSGAIALSIAKECPQLQMTATDFSATALEVAQQNAVLNQIDNVQFLQGSWYQALADNSQFDLIVSNPPYIDEQDTHLNDLSHEPITALTAKEQGLSDLKIIIGQAPQYLKYGGFLLVEHGYDQARAVQQLFVQAGFEQVKTVRDYGGNGRVTMGQWS
ncbi:peptide chain release factor N(5)-glutamine methyltransferase [Alkanindiges sp. WGS2144]|uniref:peptide chain release factor N(5)-glutamine methyltransferase n=1 Tax=Alkanindiges sp. WGS2144 TaxID=3366808 RepID=UPI003750875E